MKKTDILSLERKFCASYCQTGWQLQMSIQDYADANIFLFSFPFYFSFFFIFVQPFLTWVMIFYGDPLLSHWGSSFWIDVEWTSFILCLVLILLVSWGNSPLLTLLTARDVRAQNCESRFKSMILVEFLIPAFSFGCYGPGLTGVLNSRPAVFQRVIGEKFSFF